MRSIKSFLVSLAILSSVTAAGQQADLRLVLKVPNAVAVDGLPEVGYYVLAADNAVYRYAKVGSDLQFVGRFSLQGTAKGIDLTFVRDDTQGTVVVTQWDDKLHLGFVYRYSPEGKVIQKWSTLRHIPTGLVYDPTSHLVYFATADSNELYAADLQGGSHQLCEIRGAVQIGPITLDVERHLIYAADREGALFVVDLHSKKVTRLSLSFGLASALRLDGKNQKLYVADNVQRKIYVVDLSTQNNRVIVDSAQIKSPSGLAPGPENALLFTDRESGGVYLAKVDTLGPAKPSNVKQARKKAANQR
jgi:DNA-binding beta-propeller fold protein YncE